MTHEDIARGLSEDQRDAIKTIPLPREPVPHLCISGRSYGSIWRKSSDHWDALCSLERQGLAERRVVRGETLWRATKPLGLAVRAILERENG